MGVRTGWAGPVPASTTLSVRAVLAALRQSHQGDGDDDGASAEGDDAAMASRATPRCQAHHHRNGDPQSGEGAGRGRGGQQGGSVAQTHGREQADDDIARREPDTWGGSRTQQRRDDAYPGTMGAATNRPVAGSSARRRSEASTRMASSGSSVVSSNGRPMPAVTEPSGQIGHARGGGMLDGRDLIDAQADRGIRAPDRAVARGGLGGQVARDAYRQAGTTTRPSPSASVSISTRTPFSVSPKGTASRSSSKVSSPNVRGAAGAVAAGRRGACHRRRGILRRCRCGRALAHTPHRPAGRVRPPARGSPGVLPPAAGRYASRRHYGVAGGIPPAAPGDRPANSEPSVVRSCRRRACNDPEEPSTRRGL